MYALLGRYIRVLWGFQQTSRVFGVAIYNYTDKYQQSKCHEHLIFPVNIHQYESVSEPDLFYQASFFPFQLQDNHNSYSVDHGIITNKLNRVREGYVHSPSLTINLSFIHGTQSLVFVAWQFQHFSPRLDYKFWRQHTWDIPSQHNAPS